MATHAGDDHVQLVLADPADERVGRHGGGEVFGDHQRLVGADLAGRAPVGFEQAPELGGGLDGPDDGGAAAAGPAGTVGEAAYGLGGGADGDEVGTGVAERAQAPVRVPAPHLAAEAPGVEPGDLHAGGHEGVRDGIALQDGERRAEFAGFEDPGGGVRQHEGLTERSADLRTVPGGRAERRPQAADPAAPVVRGRGIRWEWSGSSVRGGCRPVSRRRRPRARPRGCRRAPSARRSSWPLR